MEEERSSVGFGLERERSDAGFGLEQERRDGGFEMEEERSDAGLGSIFCFAYFGSKFDHVLYCTSKM